MNAPFVVTASRTRTRQNATKTAYTLGGIAGRARHCMSQATTKHSTKAAIGLAKLTPAAIVGMSLRAAAVAVVIDMPLSTIGMRDSVIFKRCTNFENATRARSFSGQTISDNI